MRDARVVPVAAGPAREHHPAGLGRTDRRAFRGGEVDPRVQAAPARPERRREGAADGPDHRPGALPDRPRARGAGQPRADPRLLALERDEMPLELLAVRSRGDERLAPVRAHRLILRAAVEQPALDRRDLRAPVLDEQGDLALTRLGPVEALLGGRGVGSRGADAVDDPGVLLGDALHELRPLKQIGEPVGLQDDGHEVGLVGLVEVDEPLGQRDPRLGQTRPQADDPGALGAKVGLDRRELRAPAAELALDRRLARAQLRDVALQHADPARIALDRRRQDALTVLLGLDRPALLLDLALQLLAVGRDREEQPQEQGHRRDGDDEAHVSHSGGILGRTLVPPGGVQASVHALVNPTPCRAAASGGPARPDRPR